MFPVSTMNNVRDDSWCYREVAGNSALGVPFLQLGPDQLDVLLGELRSRVSPTSRTAIPFDHVPRILCGASRQQMFRPDTERGIAGVANYLPARDGSVENLPAKPMSLLKFSVHRESAVAVNNVCRPEPTVTGSVDLGPESLQPRLPGRAAPTMSRVHPERVAVAILSDIVHGAQPDRADGRQAAMDRALHSNSVDGTNVTAQIGAVPWQ